MRQGSGVARRRSLFRMLARGVLFAGLAVALAFIGLVALYAVAPPVSTLMLARTIPGKSYERIYVPLSDVAPVAAASVIASEDATFCRNHGVDWGALHEVMSAEGLPTRGASTIKSVLEGGVVTTTRSDVDTVVTEYGVAHLRGISLGERARRLSAIAAPEFRDQLDRERSTL